MRRRTLLGSISAAAIAGCIGDKNTKDANSDGWDYEQCSHRIVSYNALPKEAKEEVDSAFEEGSYKSDDGLYYERLLEKPEKQALSKDESYYVANITQNSGSTVLQFEKTIPQYNRQRYLRITNDLQRDLNLSIIVKDSNDTVLRSEKMTIGHIETISNSPKVPISNKYGEYTFEIEIEDQWKGTKTTEMGKVTTKVVLGIRKDENEEIVVDISQPPNYPSSCPWR